MAARAAANHGLVTTAELRDLGLTHPTIGRLAASGQIERVCVGVYRVPPYPRTWEQRVLTAVLAGPTGTVASHRSAARLHGLRGIPTQLVEITCRRWKREHPPRFVVHESLQHDPRETTVIDGIAVTDLARTFVDLGAVLPPAQLGRALDESRRQGQIDLATVRARLEERAVQGRNGIAIVRQLLAERSGQPLAGTGLEQLLLEIIASFRLPRPETQWRVDHLGRTAFLDFAYPAALVTIEIDSEEYHLDLATFHGDRSRQNWLSLLGWTFLRFTTRHLRHDRYRVARQIDAALNRSF